MTQTKMLKIIQWYVYLAEKYLSILQASDKVFIINHFITANFKAIKRACK